MKVGDMVTFKTPPHWKDPGPGILVKIGVDNGSERYAVRVCWLRSSKIMTYNSLWIEKVEENKNER